MTSKYETVYILRADLTEGGIKKINDKLSELVAQGGGRLAALKDLGRKQLAYRINKQMRGHYFQANYEGAGGLVGEVERNLRLTEEVIRFLTVKEKRGRGASRAAAASEGKVH